MKKIRARIAGLHYSIDKDSPAYRIAEWFIGPLIEYIVGHEAPEADDFEILERLFGSDEQRWIEYFKLIEPIDLRGALWKERALKFSDVGGKRDYKAGYYMLAVFDSRTRGFVDVEVFRHWNHDYKDAQCFRLTPTQFKGIVNKLERVNVSKSRYRDEKKAKSRKRRRRKKKRRPNTT